MTREPTRILVIDDDELVLTIVRKLLEAEMFTVDVSLSAREAINRLPDNYYSAILCDMWMPGMTGKDFYHQVRKEFPEYQGRIIFLTGDIASEATWDFIEQRRLPYVLKPVNVSELRRKLQEVVGEWSAPAPASAPVKKGAEARRHRRIAMKASVGVRRKKWATGGPEITAVSNASKEGVYFLTERQYRLGTEVLVSFPYTGPSDVEQEGVVVRVDERSEGRRGVAIATGEAATMARASMVVSEEERKRERILALADMSSSPAPIGSVTHEVTDAADLKLQLVREREEIRRLAQVLADLKVVHERAGSERDRLLAEKTDRNLQLREFASAKAAMSQVIQELKNQLETLRNELATAEAGRAKAEMALQSYREEAELRRTAEAAQRPVVAAKEAAAAAAGAPARPLPAQESPAQQNELARLREQLAEMEARIQGLQAQGVAPLTILAAYCDMLGMNKSLDSSTKRILSEISEQASLLRSAFQKFLKK